jgi:hypothetical protein
MADQAFPEGADAALANTGVLIGSVLAATLGAAVVAKRRQPPEPRSMHKGICVD